MAWRHVKSNRGSADASRPEPEARRRRAGTEDSGGDRSADSASAARQVLKPKIDPIFSEYSYGFRPDCHAQDAALDAQRFLQDRGRATDICGSWWNADLRSTWVARVPTYPVPTVCTPAA